MARSRVAVTQDIVHRLWNLCHILRDDGITYHEYVTELGFLIFLEMAAETGQEHQLPEGYRWADLARQDGVAQLEFYRELLAHLGRHGSPRVQAIFAGARTALRKPGSLARLVAEVDRLDWYSAAREDLGDLYEGLLARNAGETRSGAGQYFTPRPLIETMVACLQPRPGEVIQDPAAGTAGFLVHADRYIKQRTSGLHDLSQREQQFQRTRAFVGVELVPDVRRLALMNLLLHDIECAIHLGDTLSPLGADLPRADVILSNPPFGTRTGGGAPRRDDLPHPTSNKQLAFLQHIHHALKPGGRAAVVVPDNVLFEANIGPKIRADLMDRCNLHTILRLPTGIFYAQGVKTNVLFFTRGTRDRGNTREVWIHDLRSDMPSFGKRTPLTREHFEDFAENFGDNPDGTSRRQDQGEDGRFRCFRRDEIARRGDNLDISWLRDDSTHHPDDLDAPEVIAAEILQHLSTAMEELQELQQILAEDGTEPSTSHPEELEEPDEGTESLA